MRALAITALLCSGTAALAEPPPPPPCTGLPHPTTAPSAAAASAMFGPASATARGGEVLFSLFAMVEGGGRGMAFSTWLYRVTDRGIETLGELAKAPRTLVATSDPHGVVAALGTATATVCRATGTATLPPPALADVASVAVGSSIVTANVARERACRGATLSIATLDTSTAAPAWKTLATRTVVSEKRGGACIEAEVKAAAVTPRAAAFVLESCPPLSDHPPVGDAECTHRVELWRGRAWTTVALPGAVPRAIERPVVSIDGDTVRVATGGNDLPMRIYRIAGSKAVAEGDAIRGVMPVALSGTRIVTTSAKELAVELRELRSGAWTVTSAALPVADLQLAIAWRADGVVAVVPAADPTTNLVAHVFAVSPAADKAWRDLGTASITVAP